MHHEVIKKYGAYSELAVQLATLPIIILAALSVKNGNPPFTPVWIALTLVAVFGMHYVSAVVRDE